MKVAIIGSRREKNTSLEYMEERLPAGCSKIISGGARGVDTLAERLAGRLGLPFVKFLPDYGLYGRWAPLKRNIKIIENADLVLAFWDFRSRGTAFTIIECLKRQIPVRVYPLKD